MRLNSWAFGTIVASVLLLLAVSFLYQPLAPKPAESDGTGSLRSMRNNHLINLTDLATRGPEEVEMAIRSEYARAAPLSGPLFQSGEQDGRSSWAPELLSPPEQ